MLRFKNLRDLEF